ncbi:Cytochrome P460 monooxygenase [Paramyrothecium foliicola]|nr:Cytochrome P460 monooxygenase [Paramyrothecium foliicola]
MDRFIQPTFLVAFTTLFLTYLAGIVTYRLFFHPLANFPGPKLAAATRRYEAYDDILCGGRYTFKIAELHKQYGPIIRISPHELQVIDSDFYEHLYRQDCPWNKYAWAYDAFGPKYATICTADHFLHRQRRAPLNPNTEKLCNRISSLSGTRKTLDIDAAMSAFTRDVALEFLLDKRYNNLDASDFNGSMATIFQNAGIIWQITEHIRWCGPLLQSIPLSFLERVSNGGAREFFIYLRIMADPSTLKTDSGKQRTLVHAILQSDLPESEKTFDRMNEDVSTITGAAFETTAQTLRAVLYYVFSDNQVLCRLRQELKANGLAEPALDYAQLENYLTFRPS